MLSFLLTSRLREMGIAHYLLRAAPDGEGNWFHLGETQHVRQIRLTHKVSYQPAFVAHMTGVIRERHLPLLVDIGGKPRADQFNLLAACTHSIVLYREPEERREWLSLLERARLAPLAELCSRQQGQDRIDCVNPVLRGVISGLDRDPSLRHSGIVFEQVLLKVVSLFRATEAQAETAQLALAPFPPIVLRELGQRLAVPTHEQRQTWEPAHLRQVSRFVPAGCSLGVYGPGPVWLMAALAVLALPAGAAIFDARFGWLEVPQVIFDCQPGQAEVRVGHFDSDRCLVEVHLPEGVIEPDPIHFPQLQPGLGVILSGKLPAWYFSALARALAARCAWTAIYDPRLERAVVVFSQAANLRPGDTLPVPPARRA